MTTKYRIDIKFQNGDSATYKEAGSFQFMPEGVFFVEGYMVKKPETVGLLLKKMTYENVRNWYPIASLKSVQITTTKVIDDPEEIRKYERFLEHGIDLMVTKVSHTEPKDPAEVAKEIEKEDKKRKEKSN